MLMEKLALSKNLCEAEYKERYDQIMNEFDTNFLDSQHNNNRITPYMNRSQKFNQNTIRTCDTSQNRQIANSSMCCGFQRNECEVSTPCFKRLEASRKPTACERQLG